MDLRLKLIIPTLVMLVALTTLLHFYWLPNYIDAEIEQEISHERAYIRLLGDIITTDLVSNDLASIHATLNKTLQVRKTWHDIRLYKLGELRIYPLEEKPAPGNKKYKPIHHPILLNDETIANLTVWLDTQSSIENLEAQIRYLEQILISIIFGISLAAIFFQDKWIRNPLKQLAALAQDVAQGDYTTALEYHSTDEVGKLVNSFNAMREQVELRERELKYYSHLQNSVRNILDKFINNINDKYVFMDLLQEILDLTGSEHGYICEVLNSASKKPYLKAFSATDLFIDISNDDNVRQQHGKGMIFDDIESLPAKTLATRQPVLINDPGEIYEVYAIKDMENFLGLPIKRGRKIIGVIGLANRNGGYLPEIANDLQILLATLSGLILAYNEEKALYESEARFRSLVNNAPYGIATVNREGIIISCNNAFESTFDYPGKELIGRSVKALIPVSYHAQYETLMHTYVALGDKNILGVGYITQGQRKDGTIFPIEVSVSELKLKDETLLMGITQDVTKRVYAESAQKNYSTALERLHNITANPDLNFDQKINELLKLGQNIFNLPMGIISHISGLRYIIEYIQGPEGAPEPGSEFPFGDTYCYHTFKANGPIGFDDVGNSPINSHPCYKNFGLEAYIGAPIYISGKRYGTLNFSSLEVKDMPFTSTDYTLIQLFAQWVSAEMTRAQTEEALEKAYINVNNANAKLETLSRTDGLTGVANRRYFDEVLTQELNRATRHNTAVTLMICDIDYFKEYNDTYGHQAGDACLQLVTKAIQSSFSRAGELVARYGGEEFAVIIPEIDEQTSIKLAEEMRNNVSELKLKHRASKISDHVTISVGLTSIIPDQNTTMSVLIGQADTALYRAKEDGRNNVKSFIGSL